MYRYFIKGCDYRKADAVRSRVFKMKLTFTKTLSNSSHNQLNDTLECEHLMLNGVHFNAFKLVQRATTTSLIYGDKSFILNNSSCGVCASHHHPLAFHLHSFIQQSY